MKTGDFMNDLYLKQLPARGWWDWKVRYEVGSPLGYRSADTVCFTVPFRFVTDLASVPRDWLFIIVSVAVLCGVRFSTDLWLLLFALMFLFPRSGLHNRAAVLHDFFYTNMVRQGVMTRKQADGLFYEALRVCKMDVVRAFVMWALVRLFGGVHMKLKDVFSLSQRRKGHKGGEAGNFDNSNRGLSCGKNYYSKRWLGFCLSCSSWLGTESKMFSIVNLKRLMLRRQRLTSSNHWQKNFLRNLPMVILLGLGLCLTGCALRQVSPQVIPTAAVQGNSWQYYLTEGTVIVPCNEFAGQILGRAGVNELLVVEGGYEVAPGQGLIICSKQWMVEQLEAEANWAARVRELETELLATIPHGRDG